MNGNDESVDIEDTDDQLIFLKTTVLKDETTALLHRAFHVTRTTRKQIIKDENKDILAEFPYFFTYPELVSQLCL